MEVGELGVVETEQAKQGDVHVADVVDALDRTAAELVGRADGVSGLDAAAGQPDRHRLRVVVAAERRAHPDPVVGRAAELAAPDDQGRLEQSGTLQVGDQPGDRPVDRADQVAVGALDVVVRVPGAGIELDEADSALDQPAGEQALAAECVGRLGADAVESQRLRRLPVRCRGYPGTWVCMRYASS